MSPSALIPVLTPFINQSFVEISIIGVDPAGPVIAEVSNNGAHEVPLSYDISNVDSSLLNFILGVIPILPCIP